MVTAEDWSRKEFLQGTLSTHHVGKMEIISTKSDRETLKKVRGNHCKGTEWLWAMSNEGSSLSTALSSSPETRGHQHKGAHEAKRD